MKGAGAPLLFATVALCCLGIALAIHEIAHVLAARALGFKVQRWAFGAGPRLLRRCWAGVEVIFRLLPVWAESAIEAGPRRGGRWVLLLLTGPLASLLFGLLLLTALHLLGTHVPVPLTIGEVQPGSEAARAQLLPGDRVRATDGVALTSWSDLTLRIDQAQGQRLRLTLSREGSGELEVVVAPRAGGDGVGRIGVSQQYVHRKLGPADAVVAAFQLAVTTVRDLIEAAQTGRRIAPRGAGAGWSLDTLLRALAAVSILLGLLHLVPIPPLDAGVAALGAWERWRGRPLSPGQRAGLQLAGLALFAALALLVATSRS